MKRTHAIRWMTIPGILALHCAMVLVNCGEGETRDAVATASSTTGSGGTGGSTSSGAGGTSDTGGGGAAPGQDLDPTLAWYGDNRERLDVMIHEHGVRSPTYEPAHKPVAVFDWDNTVIKNDIGDATMFWSLRHDKVIAPPSKDWSLTSPYLTSDAIAALSAACDALAPAGQPLPTSNNTACADEILTIYSNGVTTTGLNAWTGYDHRTIEPAYAWVAQLQAGLTPDEVRAIAGSAIEENLAAMPGSQQTVGTIRGLTAWIRIYDPMKDLIDTLQKNGFDVWVVSASPQHVVEPFAALVNVPADHVVGIRALVDTEGKLTSNLAGCGPVPDGTNDGAGRFTGNSLIPYIDGKRCWINKVVYGDAGPTALDKPLDPAKRQVFAAGDSTTDVSFVQDATALKLVLNRNKTELMCNAYRSYGGRWLINPMFIDPKGQLVSGYDCVSGCVDKDGAGAQCLDESGAPIPDQADNVY